MALSLGWLATLLGREMLPPLLPTIIHDLAISSSHAGFALTLLWAIYAIMHFPSGQLSDQLTRTTVIVAGLGVMVVGFGVLSWVHSYSTFLLGVGLIAVGSGLYYIPSRALLSDLYAKRRGQAFGIQGAAGNLGSMLAAGVAAVAIGTVSWQMTFPPVATLLFIVLVLVHSCSKESYVLTRVQIDVRETGTHILRIPSVRWLLLTYTLYAFVWSSFLSFLPTFLQVERGFSPLYASGGFALLFLVGIFSSPLAGNLGDQTAHLIVVVGALFLGIVGLLSLVFVSGTLSVMLSIVLIAVGLRSFPPVMQAHLMDLFADKSMGGDLGALKTVYNLVGSLGPTYVGLAVSGANYSMAFLGLVPMLFAAMCVTAWRFSTE